MFNFDADKGLKSALETPFSGGYHAICVWHLAENVRVKHGGAQAAGFVFRLAKAKTVAAYLSTKEELLAGFGYSQAIDYLDKRDKDQWVRC